MGCRNYLFVYYEEKLVQTEKYHKTLVSDQYKQCVFATPPLDDLIFTSEYCDRNYLENLSAEEQCRFQSSGFSGQLLERNVQRLPINSCLNSQQISPTTNISHQSDTSVKNDESTLTNLMDKVHNSHYGSLLELYNPWKLQLYNDTYP